MTDWPQSSDSHNDYFARNITVYRDGRGQPIAPFRSNAVGRPWPTADDVEAWMLAEGYGSGTNSASNTEALAAATNAARSQISERIGVQVHPLGDDGLPITGELVVVPPEVWLATVMHAAKLYNRRNSTDGTLGASAFGGAVRVGRFDPDVEALLANHLLPGLA